VKTFVFAGFLDEGKQIEGTFAQYVFSLKAANAFHAFVPGDVTIIGVECEYALDAGVKELAKKQVAF
jgi:hypothetical protein